MEPRKFRTLMYCVIGACLVLTVLHFGYAVYAYNHSSIIYFIAKELW